jgi:hypothetical protein
MASIRKRGTKWEYRIHYKDQETCKNKQMSRGGFSTKKEAHIAALEIETKMKGV